MGSEMCIRDRDKTIQEDTMKYIKQYLSKHFPGTKFEVVPEIV